MKKHAVFSLLIAMAVLSISCDRQTISRLDEIESYIQERPDSALTAIRNIDRTLLHSREGKAKYSLLEAMALDKNYIDTMDVNVIMPAVEYYRKHGTPDERLKSLYYQTAIQVNGRNYSEAAITYTEALPLLDQCEDKKYCGLMCEKIAGVLNASYSDQESLVFLDKSIDYYYEADLLSYVLEVKYSKALLLIALQRVGEAKELLYEISTNSPPDYLTIKTNASRAYIDIIEDSDDIELSAKILSDIISRYGTLPQDGQWGAYAFALNAIGKESDANKIISQLLDSQDAQIRTSAYHWQSLIEEARGNIAASISSLRELESYRNIVVNNTLKQSSVKAQRDYFEVKAAESVAMAKNQRLLFYLVIALLIAAVSVGYTVLRKKADVQEQKTAYFAELAETVKQQLKDSESARRMVAADYNELTAESQELKKQLEEREHTMALLRAEYSHMYKEKFNYLGELCETYFRYEDSGESQKRHVYEKVEEMLTDIRDDVRGQARFEKMIDANLNNIMKRFREDFPKYSEDDYLFISYVFIGFDATTLLSIFHMPSQASVYCKKARIKSNIQKSDSKYKSYFLEMFA